MNRRLLDMQSGLLALGVVFSWTVLVLDYRRFFESGGSVFQFSGCVVSNPLATPCFYGALAFAIALAWSLVIRQRAVADRPMGQGGLHGLLIAATVFAWGNFAYEVYRYLQPHPAPGAFSCPTGEAVAHPLATPCFYGAMIYLCALLVSFAIRRSRN
jgi:hypothetical protein